MGCHPWWGSGSFPCGGATDPSPCRACYPLADEEARYHVTSRNGTAQLEARSSSGLLQKASGKHPPAAPSACEPQRRPAAPHPAARAPRTTRPCPPPAGLRAAGRGRRRPPAPGRGCGGARLPAAGCGAARSPPSRPPALLRQHHRHRMATARPARAGRAPAAVPSAPSQAGPGRAARPGPHRTQAGPGRAARRPRARRRACPARLP